MRYVSPAIGEGSFTCPYCNTLAQQTWDRINIDSYSSMTKFTNKDSAGIDEVVRVSHCHSCEKYHIWLDDVMIRPDNTTIPLPNDDMPEDVKEVYLEASQVLTKSPKAAAALLRLGLQYLCKHLGGEGENIETDIKGLISKGLDHRVQRALDVIRITGNQAVHPGEIDFSDGPDSAVHLFSLLNFIVEQSITRPQAIDSFFNNLPSGPRDAAERRSAQLSPQN